jgi:hypothetical protein
MKGPKTKANLDAQENWKCYSTRALESLRSALADVQTPEEMNHAPFRHVLVGFTDRHTYHDPAFYLFSSISNCLWQVVDESGHGLGNLMSMLCQLVDQRSSVPSASAVVEGGPLLIYVSDFVGDASVFRRTELEAKLKTAIEQGRTVVLVNAASMFSSLYDVLNKHYFPVERQGSVSYYANIGIGSFSRPCRVHERARIIVYIPMAQLPSIERPFLARFEKYRLSVSDVLAEAMLSLEMLDRKEGTGVTITLIYNATVIVLLVAELVVLLARVAVYTQS